jgi:hypothetical protein
MTTNIKKRAMLFCLLLMASWVSRLSGALWAAEFYVATDGNDSWSGRIAQANAEKTDGPVATIGRAQQLVRELKAKEP